MERTSSRAGVSPSEVWRLSRRTVSTATQRKPLTTAALAYDAAHETHRKAAPAPARKKLAHVMDERMKQSAVSTSVKKFSVLVGKWKETEGVTLGRSRWQTTATLYGLCVLPTFKDRDIKTINRKAIQDFLTKQAKTYSKSYLKSMRVTLCMTLAWAEQNGYIQQPNGWLDGIRLPRETPGRKITRTELKPEQTLAFVARMKEPYSTLVLLLPSVGLRGEAAVGLQPTDLDKENVLHVRRVIYNGKAESLEKEEQFPLDAVVHADLLRRLRTQGAGAKWILHSRAGTPINLGNARRRHLHPTAAAIGVVIGAGTISGIRWYARCAGQA